MSKYKKWGIVFQLLFAIIFTNCIEEEEKAPIPDTRIRTIELMPDYRFQVYYDLETDSVISRNLIVDWDLGFEASGKGKHVILNTSKFMFLAELNTTNFDTMPDISLLDWKWDDWHGDLNRTAMGEWYLPHDNKSIVESKALVYILNLGQSQSGKEFGYKKIQFEKLENDQYFFKSANLDGSDEIIHTIKKDSSYTFNQYSFLKNNQVQFEPPKESWDLLFTRYTYIFYQDDPDAPIPFSSEYLPYTVIGVLSNRYQVEVAEDHVNDYFKIGFSNISGYSFQHEIDVIGWNWKVFADGKYKIKNNINNYIIKTVEGNFFKLMFVGFYSNEGVKGNPSFIFEKVD
ncbi:HmuY family protein [Bacteroidota bacterium]